MEKKYQLPGEKIHYNDIKDGTEMRETKTFIVGDKRFWADRITKDQLCTHADCERCKKEFKKRYLCINVPKPD